MGQCTSYRDFLHILIKKPVLFLVFMAPLIGGCSLPYIVSSGYNQMRLMSQRVPIERVLKNEDLPEETRQKLLLAQEAQVFAMEEMGLSLGKNYQTYVELDRPFVTWIVTASRTDEVEPYLWRFPIVGHVPYKGYFNRKRAERVAQRFNSEKYDTWVRGVSAYSTLGWFSDPLLSSMLRGRDHHLVDLIIHESVHATLYIKNHADFNERLATYLGNYGTYLFYLEREGEDSETLRQIKKENEDSLLFSQFLSQEIEEIRAWYAEQGPPIDEEKRQSRLKEIQKRFKSDLAPQLQTQNYSYFTNIELNNAVLSSLGTYVMNLKDFEKLMELKNGDIRAFIEFCRRYEDSKNPTQELREYLLAEGKIM